MYIQFVCIFFFQTFTVDSFKTNRNSEKYLHEGFLFVFDKRSADLSTKFWRCEFKNVCKARLHTSTVSGQVVKVINDHNHGNDAAKIEAAMVTLNIKRRAEETAENPIEIIANCLQGTTPEIQEKIASKRALLKIVHRTRNNIQFSPHLTPDTSAMDISYETDHSFN